MDLQLKGKTALVTGSTAGIGFAIAERLAAEGAKVWVNGRTQQRVDAAVSAIKGDVKGLVMDLSRADVPFDRIGDIDILVNNLGIYELKPFEEITDADWLRIVETNFLSGVRLSRHWLPKMKQVGWGRILFISSESAVNIPTEMVHYGVTKIMQVALARGLAQTTVGTGVTVNSILVGPTKSEGVGHFIKDIAAAQGVAEDQVELEFFSKMRPGSLIKRFLAPEEIGAMAAFLASPLSSGTNGAALRVEGGLLGGVL
jgi:NAD(P)-dependent dehydrogenase (short-subunit alcohol dehydrogenase family)